MWRLREWIKHWLAEIAYQVTRRVRW